MTPRVWPVADSRCVLAEFTIYGQSQAERELLSLPCLCDQGVLYRGAVLSTISFIWKSNVGQTSIRKMPYELSKCV